MANVKNIVRKRGNTRRISLTLQDKKAPIDLTAWRQFKLIINSEKTPTDTSELVETITGKVSDARNGKVFFSPSGKTLVGNYFYEVSCLDGNKEIYTFLEGTFTVEQDISKK